MDSLDSYRMDVRTREQFEKDIALGTSKERDIIERYKRFYELTYNQELFVEDNGCDNSGSYLENSQVTTKADYRLNGKLVEVKFNNHELTKFRLKKAQLESYIRQGAIILWVNGYETDNPTFTIFNLRDLEVIHKTRKPIEFKTWGGKLCYEIYANEFIWNKLD